MFHEHQSLKFFFLSFPEASWGVVLICHLKEFSQSFFSEVSWFLPSISDANFDCITECTLFFLLNLFFSPRSRIPWTQTSNNFNGWPQHSKAKQHSYWLVVSSSWVGAIESIAPWPRWEQNFFFFFSAFLQAFHFLSHPSDIPCTKFSVGVNWPFNSSKLLHLENVAGIANLSHNDTVRTRVL